jgi:saposin
LLPLFGKHDACVSVLQEPQTQEDILNYTKQACSALESYKEQCISYVTLYGPLVINMVLGYLQPESLCDQIGFCHVSTT